MNSFFSKRDFDISRCPKCAIMAVGNVPDDLSCFYSKGYFTGDVKLDGYMDYDADKQVSRITYQKILKKISENSKDLPKKMFEVGCATGFFLEIAQNEGWAVEGIDISAYAVEMAKQKGLNAVNATLENFNSEKKYSAVVMLDVIEHLQNPAFYLQKVNGILCDGGLIVITTPDSGSLWARIWGKHWHAFVPPQHLFYFNSKNLRQLLKKNGFETIYLKNHGKWFTIPYIFRMFYSWTGLSLFSSVARFFSRSKMKNFAVPINLGDTVYLIAKKSSH